SRPSTSTLILSHGCIKYSFFFQAEDGIRDRNVTGVQTCALPISAMTRHETAQHLTVCRVDDGIDSQRSNVALPEIKSGLRRFQKIGRASCRERVEIAEGGGAGERKRAEGDEEQR